MKKKIIGILICILLIATLFPEVGSLNDRTKTSILAISPHGEIAPLSTASTFPIAVIAISVDGYDIDDDSSLKTGTHYLDVSICKTQWDPTGTTGDNKTATVISSIEVYQMIDSLWVSVMSNQSPELTIVDECTNYVFDKYWTVEDAGYYRICAWIDVLDANHSSATNSSSPYCVTFEVTKSGKMFSVAYGVIIAKGIIYYVAEYYGLYEFYCAPVEKLTFIGIGGYNFEHHYYMKTFTNVTEIIGHTIRKLPVSVDYQNFITIHNEITNICNFYTP
ncbi:Uncharacterised protein [uncultured archaeon]|nr:Uncharacterised protein [uncultured archaeon]